ncbi:MAG: flagellar assembly protein FliH [Gammaproteobacteria bacterium]|nr:flagellar assembly protein FliH [Gammaproteobacteria bacterium]MBK7521516.1 flagellar assembly protein FliH [Gammaproteobacteria bacterium]MBK7729291.1 flagellar assembly protein FliH [Gammaproteobacteria bacterium]MBK9668155.1 flagellar assembly protein FliH [Gammaproteobacteria bacterium]
MSQRRIPAQRSLAYTRWSLPAVGQGPVLKAEAARSERPAPAPLAEPWRRESLEEQLVANIRSGRFAAGISASELEAIVRDAAEEGREDGYAEGFAKGLQEGHVQGRADGLAAGRGIIEDAATRFATLIDGIQNPLQHQTEKLRAAMLSLATRVARAVIRSELRTQPQSIERVVAEALAALPLGARNVRVFVCAADRELLGQFGGEARNWPLDVDDSLEPGDCRVEARDSVIDYSVSARLDAMLAQLHAGGADEP